MEAGIDGRPVPAEMIVVREVPDGVTELVIASDGHPVIGGTPAESESAPAGAIRRDPWCVAELAGTKGVLDGQAGFDDRAHLHLRIDGCLLI
ncbi:MAG TPA: hypothetical protein VN408_15585 [Actinoplanes sp.]|nr:hypothetical protein [Actinoplanes sp.]